MMRFIYDGPSLPMLESEHEVYRVQKLVNGKWETLETENDYSKFFIDFMGKEL